MMISPPFIKGGRGDFAGIKILSNSPLEKGREKKEESNCKKM